MKATRSRHGWVHMFITHCFQLSVQLHNFDLFRTCRISSFCTVAWQLARFQLTQRIARSVGDRWVSCNKSVFSLLRRLSTWRYRHFLLSARAYWTARCSSRSISPAGRALSSKPAASRRCCRSMGQTDGCTDCRHTKARASTVTQTLLRIICGQRQLPARRYENLYFTRMNISGSKTDEK